MDYAVIIVDRNELDVAREWFTSTPDTHIEVYPVGYAFCGLHRNGQRPTKIIRAYSPVTSDILRRWEIECLSNIGDKNTDWNGMEVITNEQTET